MGTQALITTGTTTGAQAATSLNALINAQNSIAQYSLNTSATLSTTSPFAIPFDTNDTQAGLFTHSSTTNTSRLTVSAAGNYRFTAQVQLSHLTTGTGQAIGWYRLNGTTVVVNSAARWSSNGATGDTGVLIVDCIISMLATDYVEFMVATTVANEWQVASTAASGSGATAIPNTPAVILTAVGYPT